MQQVQSMLSTEVIANLQQINIPPQNRCNSSQFEGEEEYEDEDEEEQLVGRAHAERDDLRCQNNNNNNSFRDVDETA